jgi:hypothetical protein
LRAGEKKANTNNTNEHEYDSLDSIDSCSEKIYKIYKISLAPRAGEKKANTNNTNEHEYDSLDSIDSCSEKIYKIYKISLVYEQEKEIKISAISALSAGQQNTPLPFPGWRFFIVYGVMESRRCALSAHKRTP